MREFSVKIKEVVASVLPITIIVLILNFTLTPLGTPLFIRFVIGTFLVVLGLAVFLMGVDHGVGPIGRLIGIALSRVKRIWLLAIFALLIGFSVSIAEPDLQILAGQVDLVTGGKIPRITLVVVVSIGIAVMMTAGLLRVIYNLKLKIFLAVIYVVILILALFTPSAFLAISFDASGATTGAMAVPFILALAVGVSALKMRGKTSENDSFGLVGITSTGAILAVMMLSILSDTDRIADGAAIEVAQNPEVADAFLRQITVLGLEVLFALLPLLVIFLILFFIPDSKRGFSWKDVSDAGAAMGKGKPFLEIMKGLLFTFIGLVLFLTGVNEGFMDVGSVIGHEIAAQGNNWVLLGIAFLLGVCTILAEPAVSVLTHEIEEVTEGRVRRRGVLLSLSLSVGLALVLSIIRILVPDVQLWHFLLPGYAIALLLSIRTPSLFVGVAFDSGGVASGPMTATFILAFVHGVAESVDQANVLVDGFGMIALVAMMPLITLQIFGLIYKRKLDAETQELEE